MGLVTFGEENSDRYVGAKIPSFNFSEALDLPWAFFLMVVAKL
jgi:hypothetical protein